VMETEMAVSAQLAAAIPTLINLAEFMKSIDPIVARIDEMAELAKRESTGDASQVYRMKATAWGVKNEFQKEMKFIKSLAKTLRNATSQTAKAGYGAVTVAQSIASGINGLLKIRTKLMESAASCSHVTGLVCPGLKKPEIVSMAGGEFMLNITYNTSLNVGGYGEVWGVSADGSLSDMELVMKLAIMVSSGLGFCIVSSLKTLSTLITRPKYSLSHPKFHSPQNKRILRIGSIERSRWPGKRGPAIMFAASRVSRWITTASVSRA
jgi:hypothetical protein